MIEDDEQWIYWHSRVCDITHPFCSRHKPGVWPHLMMDAFSQSTESECCPYDCGHCHDGCGCPEDRNPLQ